MYDDVRNVAVVVLVAAVAACTFDGSGLEDDGVLRVSGTVRDFATGETIDGVAGVIADGVSPSPPVTIDGGRFQIDGIPPFSVFHILSSSPPGYRPTYNIATEVFDRDLDGIAALVLPETYVAELAAAFEVEATGILLGRAIDEAGNPRAGVPATAFEINNAEPLVGPFFLDAERRPAPDLDATSASGWVVFFEVPPGQVAVTAAPGSGFTMLMAASPSAPTVVTLADIVVTDGALVRPRNISFTADVIPIFDGRGCAACHSGGGSGRDLGDLTLDGSAKLIHGELVEEISPLHLVTRIDRVAAAASLLLTMPSREDPPDAHPNVTFLSPDDPDYLTILVWIEEGALDN